LGLTPKELGDLTPAEYQIKCQGFEDNQRQMAWLNGNMVLMAFNASKECPYPSLEEFMNPQPKLSDEELFKKAKEKGIEIPEGVIIDG
jgi:hypothetical protein